MHARPLSLDEQRIDVWLAFYRRLADDAALLSRLRLLLDDREREQAQRFHFVDDRVRYLVTRAMVRTVLSRYAAVDPVGWVFSANAYGRPGIVDARGDAIGLDFNVSHTGGLIALGVARHRALGVDVENVARRQMSIGIADRFFSPIEAAELARVPLERRQDRFFEYWTFKESYVKARGMGLSLPLDRFSFHYPHDRVARISIDPELGDDAGRWRFWQTRPTPEHLLAICAEQRAGGAPVLTVRNVVPTVAEEVLDLPWLKTSEVGAPV